MGGGGGGGGGDDAKKNYLPCSFDISSHTWWGGVGGGGDRTHKVGVRFT